jgi:phage shock protein A
MAILTRSYNVIRGLLSSAVAWFERRNPESLLENEKENLHKLLAQFNAGLVHHAALSARLKTQISRHEKQVEILSYRIKALLGSGDRAAAAREALALKNLRGQLDADQAQMDEAERTYKSLVARRDAAVSESRHRIEQVRRQIGDLKVKRAIADLEGMAQAMVGGLDSGGASLSRLEGLVAEEVEKAGARARVSQSSSRAMAPLSDDLQDAMAEDALAEFLGPSARAIPDLRPRPTERTDATRAGKPKLSPDPES